ncbi:uncharacterized protein LOC123317922 [Coccinella septempunctata]|uniref:uncharacterized protein LOC123317922 n=1 Tax=Coccinella septempunctata TaxID=41139 RepID=UPI001D06AC48|nr:uncharacterized protein LOC123317922 [Coccinella septempunctata]
MEQRNLPKVLWISEDATRVTSKIEYDPRTNKLVGFTMPLVDGIPARDTFLATSAKAIQDHFENAIRSNYAYVIMAQPISQNAPGYCLAIFGTDNRFTAADVTKRWQHIKLNLKERGATVLGFGSDGDTRLLKAMRQGAQLSSTKDSSRPEWRWFKANYSTEDCASYVQDTVHIATKLRTRLLNEKIKLRFGDFYATAKQLEQLIAEHSKDKHLLTKSDLKLEDKMNFKAAEKLCSNHVIDLIERDPQNKGIVAYLKLMRLVIDSFLDPKIDVTHRIYSMWYCVFFLRIWRQWLTINKYKIGEHFISSNCYTCIELNAHSLINIVVNIRENPSLSSDMFLPVLFGSQKCEQTFRTMRSMTSTYSTVINFNVKDILRRLERIKTVNNIIHDLNNVISFPREQKRQEKMNIDTNSLVFTDLKHYTDTMIADAVERARQDALAHTRELGMFVEENTMYNATIPPLKDLVKDESEDKSLEDEEDIQIDDNMIDNSDSSYRGSPNVSPNQLQPRLQHFTSLPIENEEINGDDLNNPNSHLFKDLCNISSVGVMDNLILRSYDQKLMDDKIEDGPYVRVTVGNKSKIIRKSSLCWLLEETKNRVSTDRLQRFVVKSTERPQRALEVGRKKLNSLKSKGTYIKRSSKRGKRENSGDISDSSEDDTIIKYDDSPSTETFSENDSEAGIGINFNEGEYQDNFLRE